MAAEIANPNNTLVFFTSKSFDDSELPLKEKWYKIEYSSQKFTDEMISILKKPVINSNGLNLDLPLQNNLLPKNFDILAEEGSLSDRVKLLKTWEDTEIWYKKDDKFKRPKGIVNFKFYTNDCLFS